MKLLIIEDDPIMGSLIKSSLKQEAWVVDIAQDGEQGAFLAKINKYDVIILDFILPKMNGHQVLKEIRNEGITAIIIAISNRTSLNDRLDWLNAGADDYLPKPFAMSELVARIKATSRRYNRPLIPDNLIFADLSMNFKNYEVRRKNKNLNLTNKEFTLLKFFMLRPQEVLSRHLIIESVWDRNADEFSNSLETHIMRLRQKIEKYGKRLIHTVNGYGYKLDNKG